MIKPTGTRSLIKVDVKTKTDSGFILSEEQKTVQGEIIETRSSLVKKGDKVIFSKYGPLEIKENKELYVLAEEEHLLALC